eukprot:11595_1
MGCCCSTPPTNYNHLRSVQDNEDTGHGQASPALVNNRPSYQPQQIQSQPAPLKEYSVNLKAERLNNKIYRIFFVDIAREIIPILKFKFEFQYSDKPWQSSRIFNCDPLRVWKQTDQIFTYIRVPSQLCDYQMNIRLSLQFMRDIRGYLSQQWMQCGEILTVKVLSSLITSQFQVDSYVKFRPPNSEHFYYGKIKSISTDKSTNIDNELLVVCTIKDHNGRVWDNIPRKVLLQILADDYIDLCILDRNYADFELLFRSNQLTTDQFNVYCALVECGMNICMANGEIIVHGERVNQTDISAEGRCVAYNVMNMLLDCDKRDYNLKLNCLKDCGAYLHTKQAMTTVQYRIGIKQTQDWSYGCDICRTSVNEYDYMFHCDNVKELTHDFCVLCAHEMVRKHKQLTQLLYPILLEHNSLNVFCIDILVSFMVGKVNRFKIMYH